MLAVAAFNVENLSPKQAAMYKQSINFSTAAIIVPLGRCDTKTIPIELWHGLLQRVGVLSAQWRSPTRGLSPTHLWFHKHNRIAITGSSPQHGDRALRKARLMAAEMKRLLRSLKRVMLITAQESHCTDTHTHGLASTHILRTLGRHARVRVLLVSFPVRLRLRAVSASAPKRRARLFGIHSTMHAVSAFRNCLSRLSTEVRMQTYNQHQAGQAT